MLIEILNWGLFFLILFFIVAEWWMSRPSSKRFPRHNFAITGFVVSMLLFLCFFLFRHHPTL